MSRGNAARLVVLGAAVAMAVAVLLELRRPELLIVGNVTLDVVDGTSAVGGAVSYAAAVAAAFSVRACVVTSAGADLLDGSLGDTLRTLFAKHELHVVPSNATLMFAHTYTFWGNFRKLRVAAKPNVTLSVRHVPGRCRRARTIILGPLTQCDVDVLSFVRQEDTWAGWFTGGKQRTLVGLLAQGLQRTLDSAGRVSTMSRPSDELESAVGPGVVTFLSDVETERWANGTLEALAERRSAHFLVTLGAKGADEVRGAQQHRHPPHQVDVVLDTNGAGDSFATAYMLALARRHPDPSAVANWAGGAAVSQAQQCKPDCVTLALQRTWDNMPHALPAAPSASLLGQMGSLVSYLLKRP